MLNQGLGGGGYGTATAQKIKAVYYPGCTLHEKAKELDLSTRAIATTLGIELVELPGWTCCGAAYPLSSDNVIGMVASARMLANTRRYADKITTMCSFCYNVLKRVNNAIATNPEKRKKLNSYLDLGTSRADSGRGSEYSPEPREYTGEVKVLHFMELLKEYGFERVKSYVRNPLEIKIAAYYGCQVLRPEKELHFDSADNPQIFEELMKAIGATPVDFPFKTECCGSYRIMNSPETAYKCVYGILKNAQDNGADAVAVTCPLCYFNMETEQGKTTEQYADLKPIPVFYFTELLCLALDIPCDLSRHQVSASGIIDNLKAHKKTAEVRT